MSAPIRVLLVEDEPLYARLLTTFVRGLGYEPVGPAADAEAALALFEREAVDVALLDINLAGSLDGVELARALLGQRALPLIFVTSLADDVTFARAKAIGPAAYLTKPFDERTLEHALELALHNFAHQRPATPSVEEEPVLEWAQDLRIRDCLFLRDRGRLTKVCLDDVLYVEAGDKYCAVVTATGKFAVRLALRDVARELSPTRFVQTHRSYVVNADAIEHLDPADSTVVVAGTALPLGRAYRDALLSRLRLIG